MMKISVPVALSVSVGEPQHVPDGYVQFPCASHNLAQVRLAELLAAVERAEAAVKHELRAKALALADLLHLR